MMVFNNCHMLHVAALHNMEVESEKAAEKKLRQEQPPIEEHLYKEIASSKSVEVSTAPRLLNAEQPRSSLSSMRLR